jgi:hypothetical protein
MLICDKTAFWLAKDPNAPSAQLIIHFQDAKTR